MNEHISQIHQNSDYNLGAKIFHWGVGIGVLALIPFGYYMEHLDPAPFKYELYGLHKSFGMLLLAVMTGRIIWRVIYCAPAPDKSLKKWEYILSRTVHWILYAALLAMPLAGWMMTSAGQYSNNFFGLFDIPHLVGEKNSTLQNIAHQTHSILSYVILGALALHLAGAFKHYTIDQNQIIHKMMPTCIVALPPYIQRLAVYGLFLMAGCVFAVCLYFNVFF